MNKIPWVKIEDVMLCSGKEYLIKTGRGTTYLCRWNSKYQEIEDLHNPLSFYLDVTHIAEISKPED